MAEEQNVPVIPEKEDIEEEEEESEEVKTEDTEEEDEGTDDPYAELTLEQAKERLAKAEKAIVKNKKPKEPITKKQPNDDIPDWGRKIIESDEKRQFGYQHNFSPEQVDALYRYSGGKTPDENMLKRPEVSAMVKALSQKDRVAANTPKGGNAPVYKGKTFSEVATDSESSKGDKQAAFEATKKKHGVN